jgi:hypothetical protein
VIVLDSVVRQFERNVENGLTRKARISTVGNMHKRSSNLEFPVPGRAIIVPGGREAVGDCAAENGGRTVGNPTVADRFVGMATTIGTTVSAIWIEDGADQDGWWHEYARVHGWPQQPEVLPD